MSNLLMLFFIYSLMAMASLQRIHAIKYQVSNSAIGTPGGTRFETKIGIPYSKRTLQTASNFIWQTFRQCKGYRKRVVQVTMIVESMDGVAFANNNEIHVSSNYIAGYAGDVRTEITGVLYHEMTHIWQWNGNGETPGGLIEGIADFVRLKAGYAPSHWKKAGQGDRWDQGYEVTAYFLDYCNSLKDGFVADLNRRMRTDYSDSLFVKLLGKTVDQLWSEYKAQFGS